MSRKIHTLMAEAGGLFLDDTTATTGDFCALIVITNTVIDTITMPKFTNEAAVADITLYAGTILYGNITAITLTSGIVQLVNTPNVSNYVG
jgi:hypothetical protein